MNQYLNLKPIIFRDTYQMNVPIGAEESTCFNNSSYFRYVINKIILTIILFKYESYNYPCKSFLFSSSLLSIFNNKYNFFTINIHNDTYYSKDKKYYSYYEDQRYNTHNNMIMSKISDNVLGCFGMDLYWLVLLFYFFFSVLVLVFIVLGYLGISRSLYLSILGVS